MKHFISVGAAIVLSAGYVLMTDGCKKEDNPESTPPPAVEHPPATTVTLILKDSAGTVFVDSCVVRDTTILHGTAPVSGSLDLVAGRTYQGTFRLYDQSTTTTEDITPDIVSEKDAHVFKFIFTGVDPSRVMVYGRDLDSHNLPFGLTFTLVVSAGGAATGNLHVVLEHHDDGNKSGTDFDLDLDRDFPVTIQP